MRGRVVTPRWWMIGCFGHGACLPPRRAKTSPTTLSTAIGLSTSTANSAELQLHVVVITGSTRLSDSGPPRPVLADRVTPFITKSLRKRNHDVSVIDPRFVWYEGENAVEGGIGKALPLLSKPHFAYSPRTVPASLQQLHDILTNADAYVTVTPEYNHAPSPALVNLLNHFGSSVFGFKPSAIVSYSAGQWGGVRAALGLRPILSELGCLPVSAMIHIPRAQEVLDTDGVVVGLNEEAKKWEGYLERCWAQLEWWGQAAKKHRGVVDPYGTSPAFKSTPSQRNTP